ncbi:MAG: PHP domain-containing protein, partial [Spirochaetota bacterium]
MAGAVDLHIHSSFSDDGDYPVAEIFSLSLKAGLSAIAITDHDSTASVAEAKKCLPAYPGIEYIPGIELTTMFSENRSQQHILGYFIKEDSPVLIALCSRISSDRLNLAYERLDALEKAGIAVSNERLAFKKNTPPTATAVIRSVLENPDNAENILCRPYIRGEKSSNRVMNFYRDFFAEGKPAWVPFRSIPTEQAVAAIREAEGVPVLAHP